MSRKNAKVVKSINRMYDRFNLNSDEILHKTKLLLSIYRDVVWTTLNEAEIVMDEIRYFGDNLTNALVYLEAFASDTSKTEFESRIMSLFENKWMIDLIDKAMSKVYDYYNNGKLYHEIITKCYLTSLKYSEAELLEILNLERSTYYDRKREAIMLLGVSLWGYAIPFYKGILTTHEHETVGNLTEVPDFYFHTS